MMSAYALWRKIRQNATQANNNSSIHLGEQNMGSALRKFFPDAGGYAQVSCRHNTTTQSFDGITAIQEHLDHFDRLKDYLCARTKQIPNVPLICHSECRVAQWSHSESVKECANRSLIDSVCKRCEEFQEIASQSVLLTKRDLPEPVSEVIKSALSFENASKSFQTALAELYVECGYNQ
jgi:hypothetical protein